ncbi:MAG: multidrug efflux system membrane fusion protein [Gammaproteobacteria bacterium]|jgi:multidrug efflux system membrane fusion protein
MKGLGSRILVPIGILIGMVLIAAYLIGSRPRAQAEPPTQTIHPVAVVPAKAETVHPELHLYGEIASGREAEIRSMVAGRLVFLDANFRNGGYVAASKQLAAIDPFEYEIVQREQQSNLAEAQAKLRELKSDLSAERQLLKLLDQQIELRTRDEKRVANLAKKNQTSEKALDDATLALNSSRQLRLQGGQKIGALGARIEQQRAVVERNQAQLDRAERDLSDTKLIAPFSGFLQDINVANGKRVAVGESIGRLIDAAGLEVRFELPNSDYSRLVGTRERRLGVEHHPLTGTAVRVDWRLGNTGFSYTAVIERVGAEIDSSTGGVVMYARIVDGPIDILRPGAFVEVFVPDVIYENVIVLPATAVSDDRIIYLVDGDQLVALQVDVVREFADQVFIRADINEQTEVVAEQFPDIGPGTKVRPL